MFGPNEICLPSATSCSQSNCPAYRFVRRKNDAKSETTSLHNTNTKDESIEIYTSNFV